jgi:hypothetical protein
MTFERNTTATFGATALLGGGLAVTIGTGTGPVTPSRSSTTPIVESAMNNGGTIQPRPAVPFSTLEPHLH